MKPLPVLMLAAALSSACTPIYGIGPAAPQPFARPVDYYPLSAAAATGRWDNVMMLPKRARVHVLQMDGVHADGEIVSASATTLTLLVAAEEITIAAEQVARVDRVGDPDKVRRALSGAAHGLAARGETTVGRVGDRHRP